MTHAEFRHLGEEFLQRVGITSWRYEPAFKFTYASFFVDVGWKNHLLRIVFAGGQVINVQIYFKKGKTAPLPLVSELPPDMIEVAFNLVRVIYYGQIR